jgi:hypothetical protein
LTGVPEVLKHRHVNRLSDADPAQAVAQPVARALDAVIVGALVSFALSVASVLAAVLSPDGLLHEAAHFSLVGMMGVVVLARGVQVLRHRTQADPDAWIRARAVHRLDARLAEVLIVAVPLAWLLGSGAILVQHVPALHGAALMLGAWLPIGAVLWTFATFAWHDFCRDRVAAALGESDRRYREYWRDVAGS